MTGTHATRTEEDALGNKHTVDLGYEEDYKVSRAADGHWECSFKSWIFGRKHLYNGRRLSESEERHITPNGICKHAQFIIENQTQIDEAIQTNTPVHIESSEFATDIDVELNGRLAGLIRQI